MSGAGDITREANSVRAALLGAIATCEERMKSGTVATQKLIELNSKKNHYEDILHKTVEVANHLRDICLNIEQYISDKKKLSMKILQAAIEQAGNIVPDAEIEGIRLAVEGKTAVIINKQGQDINKREGSAFRSVMGVLLRYALIKAQPDCIQLMYLDEAFSTLSDATADTMRKYLDAFKDDVLVIGVEQRNYLYDGIDRMVIKVVKEENGSVLRKVETLE